MIKKSVFLALLIAITSISSVKADEGMWLPMLIKRLQYRDLQKMGLQLTAEEIYSVNHSSLKDAIVSLGGFCTAEMVSPNGLMLTNHHCGYDAIREHSTVENDILTNGFWAKSYAEEKPNPGLYASFLVRMEDVTDRILPALEGIDSEMARKAKIAELGEAISKEAEEGTHYNARVKSFFAGNEFYLFVYETFHDVRLVGAPPSSIGKFGGNTDNWMWPRQTGDFSIFRVYTGPDGNPAQYSEENIPLKPKHFLPISLAGFEEGDFSMVMGYPGRTHRYLTSYGVKQAIELKNPTIVSIRDAKLDVLRKAMDADDAVRLKYASKFAQIANYWKYYIGQTEQLKRNEVIETKEELEARFQKWANSSPELKAKYGDVLNMLKRSYALTDTNIVSGQYVVEAGLLGADAVLFSYRMGKKLEAYMKMESGPKKDDMKDDLKVTAAEFFESINLPTDKKLFAVTNKMYAKNVPTTQLPTYLKELGDKYYGKWDKYADKVYKKSIFTDKTRLNDFIENPNTSDLDKDPMFAISSDLFDIYRGRSAANSEASELHAKGMRLFEAGLQKMMPDKNFYPDANSTMRVSFGSIASYSPRDGVTYNYFTTLEGVMEKADSTDSEFIVPDKLVELYREKDYGQYADEDGTMHVNFLSTNDITGGNSGSPVMNGKGELIGIAFDGNWEAMSGDINFEETVQRTISVDIRYVLFIIDKYGGATNLIEEMTLVKDPVKSKSSVKVLSAQPAKVRKTEVLEAN